MTGRGWSRLKSWVRSVRAGQRLDTDMEEEVRFHLEERASDLARGGLDAVEARRQARVEFGPVAVHKDGMRRSLGLRWWDELQEDLRYGLRILRKNPGFTSIAVASLALAIGANTTIFSVANEMLFERLGVPHPEQLRTLALNGDAKVVIHMIWGNADELPSPDNQNRMTRYDSFAYPIYKQIRADNHVLGNIFGFKDLGRVNVTVNGEARAATAQLVSGNFYQEMQVQPVLGRSILTSDDGVPGTGLIAVISDGFWNRAFGRSPTVAGKVITINMTPVTIVGVNPRSFTGAVSVQQSPDLFMPLSIMPLFRPPFGQSGPILSSTTLYWLQLMARVKPRVSEEQARASLDGVLSAAIRATETIDKGQTMPRIMVEDGSRGLNGAASEYGKPLYVLLAMVGAVLLMACANMASLMLARAVARQREMSVRLALGAGRSRILRQVLTESLLLSFIGGVLGLGLAYLCRSALPSLVANSWDDANIDVPFNWKVFAFTAAITIGAGLLFGVLPAWAATRAEIGAALKQGAQTASRRRGFWSGKAIVAFQISLSTILITGGLLFLRTIVNLARIDPGFRADHLLLFGVNAPSQRYPAPKDVALHGQLEEALRVVPGVEEVTTSTVALIAGEQMITGFYVEGGPEAKFDPRDAARNPRAAQVGTDFISVMKIPMLSGRAFNRQDTDASPKVAIINQALADIFFPHQNPIGKRFSQVGSKEKDRRWTEIIGVCANTRYASLRKDPPPLHLDLYRQQTEAEGLTYIIRTNMKPEAIVPSLRTAVQRIDPDLPLLDIRTQKQQVDADIRQERIFASLASGFGFLALTLACVGIYGIVAYTVAQRTNEIGIRLALGARRWQVRGMVLRESTWLSVTGVAAGIAVALGLGRFVQSMLYGLRPADPVSFLGAALLLLVVALTSAWTPARRAAQVEPMEALRHE